MSNDTWRTPPEIFNYYNASYDFKIDVCASKENALCDDYIDQEENCLKVDWLRYSVARSSGSFVWCNPPYSNPLPFIKRAIDQSQTFGIGSVLLLNFDASTKWFTELSKIQCRHEIFTGSRVSFLNAEGKAIKGNPKGQFVCIIPPYVRSGTPFVEYISLKILMTKGEFLKWSAA